jgi:flagellar motor switch/type III secretory pathway protein FliN
MSDFTPEILNDVLAACNAGAEEAAGALSRTLDAQISLTVGDSTTLKSDALPADLSGPGLAIIFMVGSSGAVLVLPQSTSLVPPWCAAPDPTGQSKLATVAQELGMNFLPEAFMPEDFKTAFVKNIAEALVRGELAADAASISLNLTTADGKQGIARLIWPLAKPSQVADPVAAAEPAPKPASAATATPQPKPAAVAKPNAPFKLPAKPARPQVNAGELPSYSKSLLRIQVPVVVTLAEKKQPLGRIVEMGPGMIIQFEKSCEEMLHMEVGELTIAAGEAIKVGDKFGLRITSIVLPEERFNPVKPQKQLR